MAKKYQWAIRTPSGSYVDAETLKFDKWSGGFLYTGSIEQAQLFETAQAAAERLDRRLVEGWDLFTLVPVRVTEETVTETVTRVVGTKRSLT